MPKADGREHFLYYAQALFELDPERARPILEKVEGREYVNGLRAEVPGFNN